MRWVYFFISSLSLFLYHISCCVVCSFVGVVWYSDTVWYSRSHDRRRRFLKLSIIRTVETFWNFLSYRNFLLFLFFSFQFSTDRRATRFSFFYVRIMYFIHKRLKTTQPQPFISKPRPHIIWHWNTHNMWNYIILYRRAAPLLVVAGVVYRGTPHSVLYVQYRHAFCFLNTV